MIGLYETVNRPLKNKMGANAVIKYYDSYTSYIVQYISEADFLP